MSLYIKDLTCISPQRTFDGRFFSEDPIIHSGVQYVATEPSYKGVIPNGILRRMGKSNRMATGAAMVLLDKHAVDGILIGTTDGGMEDCHRFLNQIIKYDEGTLTPTGFVQGSPNAAAGGLALMSKNSGYNITHSNKGLSFENCILDALLQFHAKEAKRFLVGCVEEISSAQLKIETLAGFIKKEAGSAVNLFESTTEGVVTGEGAAMFVVDTEADNAMAEIIDIETVSYPVLSDLKQAASKLMERNGITADGVDAVMIGRAGDGYRDYWYNDFTSSLFPDSGIITFKNLFGETPSASAFATWFATKILNGERIHEMAIQKKAVRPIKNILIYNHFQGSQHGFILMSDARGLVRS